MIFFSLTEAPLSDPIGPEADPETDSKWSQTEPKRTRNGAKVDRNQALWGGTAGGFVGRGGGVGVVREKENHYHRFVNGFFSGAVFSATLSSTLSSNSKR